jgi:aerobic-type carbon monoxide dehydrogenase small subunit (CoxS/CutS family)
MSVDATYDLDRISEDHLATTGAYDTCDNGLCPNPGTHTVTIDGFGWRACEACADEYADRGCDITTDEAA